MVSLNEAARLLQVNDTTITRLVRSGILPLQKERTMATRKHRRYANVLLNSPTGAHLRAQPLPTVVADQDQNRSPGEGVIFNFYATNGIPVDPIYGPNGNVWFSIGGSVGEFIIGNNTIQQCPGTSGLAQEIISDNDGHV